jgi:hypothetical protein
MKFNVGDKVVMVSNYFSEEQGKVGTVIEVRLTDSSYIYPYLIALDDKINKYPVNENEIELWVDPTVAATQAERVLADDDKRDQYPLYDGLLAYFPAALCEVARWSQVGGAKHTPGEPLHWKREVSTDHENKIMRHLLDADKEVDDGFIEAVALAWRSLALCQSLLEKRGWAEGANARWVR